MIIFWSVYYENKTYKFQKQGRRFWNLNPIGNWKNSGIIPKKCKWLGEVKVCLMLTSLSSLTANSCLPSLLLASIQAALNPWVWSFQCRQFDCNTMKIFLWPRSVSTFEVTLWIPNILQRSTEFYPCFFPNRWSAVLKKMSKIRMTWDVRGHCK